MGIKHYFGHSPIDWIFANVYYQSYDFYSVLNDAKNNMFLGGLPLKKHPQNLWNKQGKDDITMRLNLLVAMT